MEVILPNWKIKKEHLDMLILTIKKIDELKDTQFFKFYRKKVQLSINRDNVNRISTVSFDELDEELIRSFFITFRVFTMGEPCSLKILNEELFDEETGEFYWIFNEESKLFKINRDAFNKYYQDDPPDINLKIQKGDLIIEFHNRKEIIETYGYGWPIHLNNPTKLAYYNAIHLNSDEDFGIMTRKLFRMELTNALIQLSKCLIHIQGILNHILEKILLFNEAWAERYLELGDYEKSCQHFHNCLYIENFIERKLRRSHFCKKISELYDILGDAEQSKGFLSKYQDIMNAVCPLPPDFWEYEYYRQYYKPSGEFGILLEKTKTVINLDDFPIIVIPIERRFELARFFEFTYVKILSYDEQSRLLKYHLPMAINQKVQFQNEIESEQGSTWEIKSAILGEKYCIDFPFISHRIGFIFLSNDPQESIKQLFIWLEKRMFFEKELAFHTGLLLEFVCILCKIEKKISPSTEDCKRIAELPSQTSYKITINEPNLDNPNQNYLMANTDAVRIHLDYYGRILDLISRIIAYQKLIGIIDFKVEMECLENVGIDPFIKNPIEGNPLIVFSLKITLYSIITRDMKYITNNTNGFTQKVYDYFSKGIFNAPSKELLLGFYSVLEQYILQWKK